MSSKQPFEGLVFLVAQPTPTYYMGSLWGFDADNVIYGTIRPLEPGEPLLLLRLFPGTYSDNDRGNWVVLDKAGTIGVVVGADLCWEGEE